MLGWVWSPASDLSLWQSWSQTDARSVCSVDNDDDDDCDDGDDDDHDDDDGEVLSAPVVSAAHFTVEESPWERSRLQHSPEWP